MATPEADASDGPAEPAAPTAPIATDVTRAPGARPGTVDGLAAVRVSVCYLRDDTQFLCDVDVSPDSNIAAAIAASGLTRRCPEVDPATMRVGIFGKLRTPDTVVREGDRIEVYRGLIADPKSARRKRVQATRKGGTREGLKWLRRTATDSVSED